jgi:hypothetical protein
MVPGEKWFREKWFLERNGSWREMVPDTISNTLVLIPLSNGTWTPVSNGTDWFEEPCAFCSQGQNVNNPQYPVALQAASPSETNNYSYVMWTYATPYPANCQFVY